MPTSENTAKEPGTGLPRSEMPLAEIEGLIAQVEGTADGDRLEHEPGAEREPASAASRRSGGLQAFDFRRPRTLSRDQVRALHIVGETFARQFTTVLSISLRSVSHVGLGQIEHMAYEEYVRSSPNPTLLTLVDLEPLPGTALLQLPSQVTMAIVDRMLGGTGDGKQPQRALTDIEVPLVREVLDRVVHEIGYAFESLSHVRPKVTQLESNPHFAQVAAPTDMMVVLSLQIRIGAVAGRASLALPHAAVQPALENVTSQSLFSDRSGVDPQQAAAALAEQMRSALVDVAVRFDPVVLTSAQIVDLQVGDVVPLRHPVSAPLSVTAEGTHVAYAVSGGKGRRLAAMIVDSGAQPGAGKDNR